ncbi:hypothetical protein V6N12_013163 [Hibiscus sabdariffa]|uniref:Uncharacterized protein n=1 Tax=Hibiscus sabdariffa TaxID=183260 RepID=A0ABR1Z8P0_9ROSI
MGRVSSCFSAPSPEATKILIEKKNRTHTSNGNLCLSSYRSKLGHTKEGKEKEESKALQLLFRVGLSVVQRPPLETNCGGNLRKLDLQFPTSEASGNLSFFRQGRLASPPNP